MSYKAKDADRLNKENEKFRSDRAKQLEREIEQATQEPSSVKKSSERKDSRKASSSSSGATGGGAEESVGAPSICPTTPLESMVSGDPGCHRNGYVLGPALYYDVWGMRFSLYIPLSLPSPPLSATPPLRMFTTMRLVLCALTARETTWPLEGLTRW